MAKTRTVLLVGDSPLACESLARLVAAEPGLVISGEARDAREALAALERDAPDVVVVEVGAGSGGGVELVELICARQPRVAVLVVAAHDNLALAERALRAGACGFLSAQEAPESASVVFRKIRQGEIVVSHELSSLLVKRLLEAPGREWAGAGGSRSAPRPHGGPDRESVNPAPAKGGVPKSDD